MKFLRKELLDSNSPVDETGNVGRLNRRVQTLIRLRKTQEVVSSLYIIERLLSRDFAAFTGGIAHFFEK